MSQLVVDQGQQPGAACGSPCSMAFSTCVMSCMHRLQESEKKE
jgi:hypothetical protein